MVGVEKEAQAAGKKVAVERLEQAVAEEAQEEATAPAALVMAAVVAMERVTVVASMAATEEVERVEAQPVDSVVVEAEAALVGQAVDMLAAVGTAEVANWAAKEQARVRQLC